MEAFVTALEAGISVATFWGVMTSLAGLIIVAVLIGFGNHKLSRVISGLGHGKAKF